jgi:NTP pyrophosphatase (non-canonical NTP hydrolase)
MGLKFTKMIYEEIKQELDSANEKFPPFKSTHEAYAVILEEIDEFWDEVKKKEPDFKNMKKELIQIAAMCVKTIENFNLSEYGV